MKLDSLEKDMVVKNYKEMCRLLEEECKNGGNAKKKQLKEWQRYFLYEKQGNKFIIKEIYEKPKEKQTKKTSRTKMKYSQLKISEDNQNDIGVYIIRSDDETYVGSTIQNFRRRFLSHKKLWGGRGEIKTYNLLKNEDATFEILENMTGKSEEEIRKRETEYIKQFKNKEGVKLINKMDEAFSHNPSQRKPKMKTIRYRIKKADYKNIKNKFDEILKEYGYEL